METCRRDSHKSFHNKTRPENGKQTNINIFQRKARTATKTMQTKICYIYPSFCRLSSGKISTKVHVHAPSEYTRGKFVELYRIRERKWISLVII